MDKKKYELLNLISELNNKIEEMAFLPISESRQLLFKLTREMAVHMNSLTYEYYNQIRMSLFHEYILSIYDDELTGDFPLTSVENHRSFYAFLLENNIPLDNDSQVRNLAKALLALNDGQVDVIVEPSKNRKGKRKNNYSLDILKLFAVCHVYFMVGQGIKKIEAQDVVAESYGYGGNETNIGTRGEPIITWEKRDIPNKFGKGYLSPVKKYLVDLGKKYTNNKFEYASEADGIGVQEINIKELSEKYCSIKLCNLLMGYQNQQEDGEIRKIQGQFTMVNCAKMYKNLSIKESEPPTRFHPDYSFILSIFRSLQPLPMTHNEDVLRFFRIRTEQKEND